jgi:hypothetical protein
MKMSEVLREANVMKVMNVDDKQVVLGDPKNPNITTVIQKDPNKPGMIKRDPTGKLKMNTQPGQPQEVDDAIKPGEDVEVDGAI